jgi:hypothetical protein
LADTSSRLNAHKLAGAEQAQERRARYQGLRMRLADIFGALQGLTITSNPRRKQIKKPTASYLYAGLASIVPTPWGKMIPQTDPDKSLPKSKMDQRTLIPAARLSSSPRDNASGVTKYLSRKTPVFSQNKGFFTSCL